ncbi:hypothetical protein [Fimbriiglobus ruber]|uniref:hypothetical protein n=1 Tax=Fimbriiglobus ruber TaxID=1908690 RepID=UPI000B4A5CAC|nr:hypothetical protein [Fimbriiglobus ruber]
MWSATATATSGTNTSAGTAQRSGPRTRAASVHQTTAATAPSMGAARKPIMFKIVRGASCCGTIQAAAMRATISRPGQTRTGHREGSVSGIVLISGSP